MIKTLRIDFSATGDFPEATADLKRLLRRAVRRTLRSEGFPYSAAVSVTFTDNEYIRELNKTYRDIDRPTDVLSFPLYGDGHFDLVECKKRAVLGDIVLSLEKAKEQAAEFGHSFRHEAAFLTIHSTLHLLGYDHEKSPEDEEIQCRKQKNIIGSMHI